MAKGLRILQVVHQFLPRFSGGVELHVKHVSQALARRGNEVWVFSGQGDGIGDPLEPHTQLEGLRLISLGAGHRRRRKGVSFFRSFMNPAVLIPFRRAIKDLRPHVIHFHHTLYLSGGMVFLARRCRIPTVFTLHDFWTLCHRVHLVDWRGRQCRGPLGGIKCGLCLGAGHERFKPYIGVPGYLLPAVFRTQYHLKLLRSVDALILPSQFMRGLVDVHVPHAPMIEHIPYGIPAANSVNRPRTPSGPVALGYLGAIKPHKGVHLLIEAFSDLQHESAVLHIHGDPTADPAYSNVLRRRCRDSRIHFKGPYDNQNVGSILSQLNAMVVPSVWRETGPMVIQEALANGIPVIAANLGGMAELVRPGVNGYLFEPGNKDALCRYMGKILSGSLPLDRLTPCLEPGHTLEHHVASLMRVYGRLTRPMQKR